MTKEQRSEFEALEQMSSARVGGIYRENKSFWILNLWLPFLILPMIGPDLLAATSFGLNEYIKLPLLLAPVLSFISARYIWEDERVAVLDDGVGRVTRRAAEIILWDDIETARKKRFGFGPHGSIVMDLEMR